jgi:hypothetical protein
MRMQIQIFPDQVTLANALTRRVVDVGICPCPSGSHIAVADHESALQLIASGGEWGRRDSDIEDRRVFASNSDHGNITWLASGLPPEEAVRPLRKVLDH